MTIIRDALGSAKDAQYSGLSISLFKLLSGLLHILPLIQDPAVE